MDSVDVGSYIALNEYGRWCRLSTVTRSYFQNKNKTACVAVVFFDNRQLSGITKSVSPYEPFGVFLGIQFFGTDLWRVRWWRTHPVLSGLLRGVLLLARE